MNNDGTKENKDTRARHPGIFACAIGLGVFFSLASCSDETSDPLALSGSLGYTDPLDIGLTTATVSPLQRNGIFIQLPAGLPNELASHLLARFQEASLANQLPLARTGTIPELTIKGVARAGTARNGTAVALIWEVLDAKGKRVMLLSGDALIQRRNSSNMERFDPWAVVDEATLEKIADAAAAELAGWYSAEWIGAPIHEPDTALATASITASDREREPIDFTTPSILQQPATSARAPDATTTPINGIAARDATLMSGTDTPQPVVRAPVAALPPIPARDMSAPSVTTRSGSVPETNISAIAGGDTISHNRPLFDVAVGLSPGDGQLSLAAAVQEALMHQATTGSSSGSAYRIIGEVTLQQSATGRAQIQIEWSVSTKSGTPLGQITQSNQLDATSVSGPWGEIATTAGDAAAAGIMELIGAPTPPV